MAAAVDIANDALQLLGQKRISSLTEASPTARTCNRTYETARDAELRAHPWVFAIDRSALAADSTAPAWGRANAFQLPSDCVRLLPPYPEDNLASRDWQVEGRKIYTDDDSPLYVRFIKSVTNVDDMDPLFRRALAATMALLMCEELTQSNTKKADITTFRKDTLAEARRTNAIESRPAVTPEDPWLAARR